MPSHRTLVAVTALLGGLLAFGQDKPQDKPAPKPGPLEQERAVKEAEVPKAALEALKKLAGGAPITEFAEEIEHGHTFYEGSWAGAGGNVDALVTAAGDLVEIEETVPGDKVPGTVRAAVEKESGKDVKLSFEKKTMILYEVHFKKDGKGREMVLTPDGRRTHDEDDQDQDEDEREDK